MSKFDEFRFSFRDRTAEQKLQILRSESLRELAVIQGHAELLRRSFEQSKTDEKSDDPDEWISRVICSAQVMRELLDALTLSKNREGLGLPELQPYESLVEAVRDRAQILALPLAAAIDDPSRIFIHSQFPLVLLDEPKYHREISFALVNSGYSVELLSFVENRTFQIEYQVFVSTLDEVTTVINQWLLDQRTADEMRKVYPLQTNGG
jgi:hypothetical protein